MQKWGEPERARPKGLHEKRVIDAQSVIDDANSGRQDGEHSSPLCSTRESSPKHSHLPFLCFVVFRGINSGHGDEVRNSVGGDTDEVISHRATNIIPFPRGTWREDAFPK